MTGELSCAVCGATGLLLGQMCDDSVCKQCVEETCGVFL